MAIPEARADLIDEILKDHAAIQALFARVESTSGQGKEEAFTALRRKLITHENAEQTVVHPLLERLGGKSVMDERLAEERKGEQVLAQLSDLRVDDPLFETMLLQLKEDVVRHASAEESEEHPRIAAALDMNRLAQLGNDFRAAESLAPTRPHPRGPSSPAVKMISGPVVGIVDRARDAAEDAGRKQASRKRATRPAPQKSAARRPAARKAPTRAASVTKTSVRRTANKTSTRPTARKSTVRRAAKKISTRPAAKKTSVRRAAKKTSTRPAVRKTAARRSAARKPATRRSRTKQGSPYTRAEIAQIKREARDRNLSTAQIARRHGRTVGGIRSLAAKEGFSLRPKNR